MIFFVRDFEYIAYETQLASSNDSNILEIIPILIFCLIVGTTNIEFYIFLQKKHKENWYLGIFLRTKAGIITVTSAKVVVG